jgi:hypothetical protein
MPLPSNFNEFEFLQSIIRKWQNRIVKEEFADLGGDEFDPDISISKQALRHACTHKDTDTAEMMQMRNDLFYIIYRKAQDLQQPVYGIPVNDLQERVRFKPQIMLFFQEKLSDIEPGYSPLRGEITFRLMNEESETITRAEVERLANKIKSLFAGSTPFVWRRGKEMFPYNDWSKGYRLQLRCRNETEAKRIIEQVLDIQGHTPQWKYLGINTNAEPVQAYPTVPGYTTILGERVRLPRKRPIGEVIFQYAVLHLHGKANPICLVDRSGIFPKPVVSR